MEAREQRGCLTAILWFVTIVISAGTGILAWIWIDPQGWIGLVAWALIWVSITIAGRAIGIALIAFLGGMD